MILFIVLKREYEILLFNPNDYYEREMHWVQSFVLFSSREYVDSLVFINSFIGTLTEPYVLRLSLHIFMIEKSW